MRVQLLPLGADFAPRRFRAVMYVIVGTYNTVFGIALFVALDLTVARYVGHYVVLTVTQVVAVANAHAAQRRWAWMSNEPYFQELARFSSVYAATYLANLVLLYSCHSLLGFAVIPSQIAITFALLFVTFFIHRAWTFRPRGPSGR